MPTSPVSKFEALGFVWEIFILIALPAVVLALLGRKYDKAWGTSPWLTVVGFLLAVVISGFLVYRRAKKFADNMKSPT